MISSTQQEWRVFGKEGFNSSLKFSKDAPVSKPGPNDVVIRFRAASLNYRDVIIPTSIYPLQTKEGVVAGSDGAGTIEAVGESVTRFKVGDRVTTLFSAGHLAGPVDQVSDKTGRGGMLDGVLRQYGTFNEQSVVLAPSNLNFQEASALPCAAVTAWNALYGLDGRALRPGDWVLTQGTGGVSVFGVQFAKVGGARVIATTSSAEKAKTLKKLGADYVINYKETPNWGEEAKKITNGVGVHHVLEVGGPATAAQSMKAVRMEGVINMIGILGGESKDQPTLMDTWLNKAIIRRIYIGSRLQHEAMNQAIEANDIRPVIDEKVFTLEQVKEAYQYLWDQKHFGKLTIKID